jgi:septal ring factor EnvC (AmiA/AmiB activator)
VFTLTNPLVRYAILALALSLAAVGVYRYIRHQGVIAEREKQFKAQVEAYQNDVAKANEVAQKLEAQLEQLRLEKEKLTKDLRDETNRDPVYRSCRVPADGLRLLRRAVQSPATR